MQMKSLIGKALAGIVLLLPLVFLLSCKKPTEPDTTPGFSISVEDVSCIEAWVRIKSQGIKLPADIVITKNDVLALTFTMTNTDTVVMIDSLQPRQTYTFRAFRSGNTKAVATAKGTTLEPTSHNFTWRKWVFRGESGSSSFEDVVIFNENNIWVGGEVHPKDEGKFDSLGRRIDAYNIARWNGVKWELERAVYVATTGYSSAPIPSVFGLNENSIWLGNVTKWDGNKFLSLPFNIEFPTQVRKIWGTSEKDIYFVGVKGLMAHYNGSYWTKIETGTNVMLNDIYGINDTVNNVYKAFIAASTVYQPGERKLLTIDKNQNIDSLHWDTGRRINSVWTKNGKVIYTSGGGVFQNKKGKWEEETQVPLFYTNRIRGNSYNDIFTCGDFGIAAHYNGIEWKIYPELAIDGIYTSCYIKNNTVVLVGLDGQNAVIVLGVR